MGSYLSEPITEKVSSDESNDKLKCGASSMQGWRVEQEDAHNCLLDFDTNTSFFAVYDGHGGREVAIHCSQKLPDFIKALDAYQKGDIKEALVDGFLGFDATIATPEVVEILKELSGRKNANDDSDEDSDEDDNLDNLCKDANLPIEKIMEKYRLIGDGKGSKAAKTAEEDEEKPGGSQKSSSSGSSLNEDKMESSNGSSSDSKESPDSSEDKTPKEKNHQNGDVSSEEPVETSDQVTSSSSPVANGQVNKKGKGKALAKTKGVQSPEVKSRPKRTSVKQMYAKLLDYGEESEDTEDEEDKTFEGPNECGSDDDEEPSNVVEGEDTSDDDDDDDDDEEDEDDEDDEADLEFAKNMVEEPGSDSGCTAVVAILKDNNLFVANAGDSRCIVCRNGKAVEMSLDHKPEDEAENERVVKAGGKVTADGRVNGGLNLSRAIGDHAYKKNKELSDRDQMITALPDVRTLTIHPNEDEFMVLACDGIWNFMSSQEVVNFVRPSILEGKPLSKICEEMFDHCLAPNTMGDGTGCDNMTAIIVEFKSTILKRTADSPDDKSTIKRAKTEEAASEQA